MDAISTFAGGVAQAVGLDAGGSSDTLGNKTDKTYVATEDSAITEASCILKMPLTVLSGGTVACRARVRLPARGAGGSGVDMPGWHTAVHGVLAPARPGLLALPRLPGEY